MGEVSTVGGYVYDLKPNQYSGVSISFTKFIETRWIKPPKSADIDVQNLRYNDAQKLADDIRIGKNDRYAILVNGSFIFGDFIEALVVKNNWHIKKMQISTLSMNEANVDSLANLMNGGYVDQLDLIVSGFHYSHKRWGIVSYTYEILDKDNKFQLAVADCHTKICTIETHNGGFITIEGSANLCSSGCVEQISVEESESRLRFFEETHDKVIDKFKTINKKIIDKRGVLNDVGLKTKTKEGVQIVRGSVLAEILGFPTEIEPKVKKVKTIPVRQLELIN